MSAKSRWLGALALVTSMLVACDDSATMCWDDNPDLQGIGTLGCYSNRDGGCEGLNEIGHYDSMEDCVADAEAVRESYRRTGEYSPGPNSHEGRGGGGGGGGGGSGFCTDEYEGPLFDPQFDSQCQAAWIYACGDNEQGRLAACDIYDLLDEQQGPLPPCPYCN